MNYPASYRRALAALYTLILSAGSVSAQLTYDADTTAPANDGAGVWDTTTANWFNGSTDVLWTNGLADTAIFGAAPAGTGGTVVVGTVNAGLISFAPQTTTGYTLSTGTITLGTGITNTSTVTNIISAKISGTSGLAYNGVLNAGTGVTLSGANDYTGITTISTGGRITSSNATALGLNTDATTSSLGTNYTQINTNATAAVTVSTAEAFLINGSGSVASGNPAGGLRVSSGVTLSSLVQLGSNAQITSNAGGTVTFNGNLDLAGFTAGIGNGNNAFTRLDLNGLVTGTSASILDIGAGGGSNVVRFNNVANAFTGTIRINSSSGTSTVELGGDTVLGTSTLVFASGGIRSTNTTARTIANTIGQFTGNATFGAPNTQTGALNFTYNTAAISLGNNAIRTFTTHVDTSFASGFSGTGTAGILKQGGGTLTISGPSTYNGVTTLNRGTLLINNTTGTGAVTVNNLTGAATSAQAGAAAANSTSITGVSAGVIATLTLGQSITGTNIPADTVITGLSGTTITISRTIVPVTANVAFSTTAFTSASTLGGIGTINGATTLNSGTFLNAGLGGTTTGVLSFGSTLSLAGTTTFDFNGTVRGTGFDGINVTGALTNGGGLVLNFSTTLTGGTYDLFALGSQSGDFASVTLTGLGYGAGSLVNSSGTWTGNIGGSDFTYVQSTGDLTIGAIPEPATFAALGGAAVLGLAALRRRRNA